MSTGRITNSIIFNTFNSDFNANLARLWEIERMISTQTRISFPSDDPLAANKSIDYQAQIEQNDQYVRNTDNAMSLLGITDSSLNDLHPLFNRAKQIALAELNASSDNQTRENAAIEISEILSQVVNVANSQLGDKYVFSGTKTETVPFQQLGSSVEYLGNSEDIYAQLDKGVNVPININGDKAFGGLSTQVSSSFDLSPSLEKGAYYGGTTDLAVLSWNPPVDGDTRTNELRTNAAVLALPVGEDFTGYEVVFTTGPNEGYSARVLGSEEIGGGQYDLEIDNSHLPVTPSPGESFILQKPSTSLSALNGGLGVDTGTVEITAGATTLNVDLSNADTIEDVEDMLEDAVNTALGATPATGLDIDIDTTNNKFVVNNNTAADQIVLKDSESATTLKDLGLITSGDYTAIAAGGTFSGKDTNPAITANTTISSLNNGGGMTNAGFRISSGNYSHVFDLSDTGRMSTIGDLIKVINESDAHVKASINDNKDGITIKSRLNGVGMTIDDYLASGDVTAYNGGIPSITVDESFPVDNQLNGSQIKITGGTGAGQTATITGSSGSLLILDSAFGTAPDATSTYEIVSANRFLGTAAGGTVNTLTAPVGSFPTNNGLRGGILKITGGTGVGQKVGIQSNTGNVITFAEELAIAPDASSTFEVITGTSATLGITSFSSSTNIEDLNNNLGMEQDTFDITYFDSGLGANNTVTIDLTEAETVNDIQQAIWDTTNQNVRAVLVNGNAFQLEDTLTQTTLGSTITITEGNSTTAQDLGLIAKGGATRTITAGNTYQGYDIEPVVRTENIFTALNDLILGLRTNNTALLNHAGQSIDSSTQILLNSRAEAGARYQRVELSQSRLEDENIKVTELLSKEIDTDYIDAMMKFNNQRDVITANLNAASKLLQTTLLDFL